MNAEVLTLFHWAVEQDKVILPLANGPKFCSFIATRSGCRVRASDRRQYQDDKTRANATADPFGSWDGNVYDFWPNGEITYLGHNIPRSMLQDHSGNMLEGRTRMARHILIMMGLA